MTAIFIAVYRGTCTECEGQVEPGQECRYTEAGLPGIQHVRCPEGLPDETLGRHERHCSCGLIHAGECP